MGGHHDERHLAAMIDVGPRVPAADLDDDVAWLQHMLAGIGLVGWIVLRARRGAFTPQYHTPVHVVGLYWSFVDIVWLTLYPLIYLVGRG